MSSQPKIVLHHLNSSRSIRIFWALEELGLEYEVKVYYRLPTGKAPPSLKQIHEFGKAPALTIGDDETISESAYIIHRLIQLVPESKQVETTAGNDSVFWSHFSEGSQMNLLQAEKIVQLSAGAWSKGQLPPSGMGKDISEEGRRQVGEYGNFVMQYVFHPESQTNLDEVESFLSKNQFFTGSTTPGIGDFMMFFALHSFYAGTRQESGYKLGEKTKEYMKRILERPGCKRALERMNLEEEKQAGEKEKSSL